jgi:hypothetical protein
MKWNLSELPREVKRLHRRAAPVPDGGDVANKSCDLSAITVEFPLLQNMVLTAMCWGESRRNLSAAESPGRNYVKHNFSHENSN